MPGGRREARPLAPHQGHPAWWGQPFRGSPLRSAQGSPEVPSFPRTHPVRLGSKAPPSPLRFPVGVCEPWLREQGDGWGSARAAGTCHATVNPDTAPSWRLGSQTRWRRAGSPSSPAPRVLPPPRVPTWSVCRGPGPSSYWTRPPFTVTSLLEAPLQTPSNSTAGRGAGGGSEAGRAPPPPAPRDVGQQPGSGSCRGRRPVAQPHLPPGPFLGHIRGCRPGAGRDPSQGREATG